MAETLALDGEALSYFLEEVGDHLDAIEGSVLALGREGRDGRLLFGLFRATHTLKGSSATVGLVGFAGIVHRFEDAVRALQDERLALDTLLEARLLAVVDHLRAQVTALGERGVESAALIAAAQEDCDRLAAHLDGYEGGEFLSETVSDVDPLVVVFDGDCGHLLESFEARLAASPSADHTEALGELIAQVEGLAQMFALGAVERLCTAIREVTAELAIGEGEARAVLGELQRARALVCLGQSAAVAPSAALLALKGGAPPESSPAAERRPELLRVEAGRLDRIDGLVGELIVDRNAVEAQHDRLLASARELKRHGWQLRRLTGGLQDLASRLLVERGAGGALPGFDSLELDRYGGAAALIQELQEFLSRIDERAADIAYLAENARERADTLKQNLEQLRDQVAAVRLQPFRQVSDRLPRAVRDLGERYGRPARLVVEGEDTLLDRVLLGRIIDPLLHLIRNAFAHGLETPAERAAAGKPTEGRITVRSAVEGNQVLVSVGDDGRGIDAAAVMRVATERGLPVRTPGDPAALLDLLSTPGFSTAERVGDLAGRGVGLDAVRAQVEEMAGTLTLATQPGSGTVFTLRLPLNQAIVALLVCEVGGLPFALPADAIDAAVSAPVAGEAAVPLDRLLPLPTGVRVGSRPAAVALAGGELILTVDQVLGEAELVLKPFPPPFAHLADYLGCAVLADGRVAPVVDTHRLVARWRSGAPLAAAPAAPVAERLLVVEDSVALRHALTSSLRRLGHPVETARDGQEALEKLRATPGCRLVLSDIEMPRLNGFELLSQMRSDPRLAQIPLVYLTSRSGEKHRSLALQLGAVGFLNKPYLESELQQVVERVLA